ncbi:MAG: acyl-ACP--UDP-N-acetylglucosamine O-acyltransferase [Alphaproteobacteria bacterium]
MAQIHSTAIVEAGARLGDGVKIGPYCVIGPQASIGERAELISHITVSGRTSLGADCVVHPFAALGGPPQHTRYKGEDVALNIGARCVIREHVTMNTGTPFGRGSTDIGDDCFFMIGSHVAHDCVIGHHVTFTNNVVVGGHVEVGNHAMIGGNSAVHQFARIGDHAFVGGMTGLENDLIPYGSCMGDRAELAGLNVVGLKRRGFSRAAIHKIRAACKVLFGDSGTLDARLSRVAEQFADVPEAMEIVRFIRAGTHRSLCLPRPGLWASSANDAE